MLAFPRFLGDCVSRLRATLRRRPRPARPRLARTPLGILALEDRMVPTVAFQPIFGAQQTNFIGIGEMKNPHVYPIFWGSYWANNIPEMNQVADQFQKIASFGSSKYDYLSGIKQYGSNGSAQIHGPTLDASSEPPGTINSGFNNPTSLEIQKVVYQEPSGVPNPGQLGTAAIYVVVTPPNVVGPTNVVGFNEPGFNPNLFHPDPREEIWVSTSSKADGTLNVDQPTRVFAHELVEAMTDAFGPVPGIGGVTVAQGANFQGGSGTQIGDNEPDGGNYVYRLGGATGPQVQAYWSFQDQQYIVPDGNSLTMQINPSPFKSQFNGGTLVIDATQAGTPKGFVGHQSIDIDAVSIAGQQGVQVIMDGQTFTFEPNQVNAIQINAANDSETITVHGSLGAVPMTVNLGTGNYVLKVDPNANDPLQSPITVNTVQGGALEVRLAPTGNLDAIKSTVAIAGSGVGSAVTVKIPTATNVTDNLGGPHGGTLQLKNGSVSYTDMDTVSLRPYSGALGTLTLLDASFKSEQFTVSGPGRGSVWMDGGTLKYFGFSDVFDLTSAGSVTYDFTGTSLFGGAPPVKVLDGPHYIDQGVFDFQTIKLQQSFPFTIGGIGGINAGPSSAVINFSNKGNVKIHGGAHDGTFNVNVLGYANGAKTLVLDPGKGNTSVNIANLSQGFTTTTVTNSGAAGDVETVTLHADGNGVQGIKGALDVQNPNVNGQAVTLLIVDDTGDTQPRTSLVGDSTLAGLAPTTISWGAIAGLTVNGDNAGNTYIVTSVGNGPFTTINAGDGNDTVTVNVLPFSAFNLHLHGGPGFDTLSVVSMFPQTVIQQTNSALITAHTKGLSNVSHIYYDGFEDVTISQNKGTPLPGGGTGVPLPGNNDLWSQELNNFFRTLIDFIATNQLENRQTPPPRSRR